MELVPRHVRTAIYVLSSKRATPRIIRLLLPTTLREIERLGKSCVALANETHVSFVTVMNLIGEVISMTETTRGIQETRLKQTEIELNVSRVMKNELTKLDKTIRSHYDDAREAVRKAQSEYSRALRKIPTGFKKLLMDLGRAVIGLVKTAGAGLISRFTGGATSIAGGATSIGGGAGASSMPMASRQTLTFARLFSDALNKAVPRVKQILNAGKNISLEIKNPVEELNAFKIALNAFLGPLKSVKPSGLKKQAMGIIQRSVDLLSKVSKVTKEAIFTDKEIPPNVTEEFESELDELTKEIKPLVAAETMSGAAVPPPSGGSAGSGDPDSNEKFAAQLSLNRLQSAESRYDKIFEQLKQNQQEMAKLMGKIASLDMTRIHYNEVLELLREALRLLSRIREQWGQLVLFFAEIAARVEITVGDTLGPFIAEVSQASSSSLILDERLFFTSILKWQTGDINLRCRMLYIMSRTYVDMSAKYIMGRLAGLSKMLVARDATERKNLLQQLNAETNITQQAVMELVTRRKKRYNEAVEKRKQVLNDTIFEFGGPDADDKGAMKIGEQLIHNQ